MGIKDFADKAGDMASGVRETVGDAAEKAVDKLDDVSGGRVPDAVKNVVDKIDGEDEISET